MEATQIERQGRACYRGSTPGKNPVCTQCMTLVTHNVSPQRQYLKYTVFQRGTQPLECWPSFSLSLPSTIPSPVIQASLNSPEEEQQQQNLKVYLHLSTWFCIKNNSHTLLCLGHTTQKHSNQEEIQIQQRVSEGWSDCHPLQLSKTHRH